MSNLDKLTKLREELKPEFAAISAGEAAKRKIIKAVSDLSVTFDPADADDEDTIRDVISDIAWSIDHSWNGSDEWETWSLGERARFWVPSTC